MLPPDYQFLFREDAFYMVLPDGKVVTRGEHDKFLYEEDIKYLMEEDGCDREIAEIQLALGRGRLQPLTEDTEPCGPKWIRQSRGNYAT